MFEHHTTIVLDVVVSNQLIYELIALRDKASFSCPTWFDSSAPSFGIQSWSDADLDLIQTLLGLHDNEFKNTVQEIVPHEIRFI